MGRTNVKREKAPALTRADLANAQGQNPPLRDGDFVNAQGSLHNVSHDMKVLIQGVQNLRQLGVEDSNLPLPKIVVVGDQSTGKSSLIEGMSEIQVPRSAGTCTRCPLEINLTENTSQWTCQVSLCKKYVYDGLLNISRRGHTKSEAATRARPLGRWVQQSVEESSHFHTFEHKDDVSAVLRLAQLAILNPGTSSDAYKPGHVPAPSESIQVKFSPNIIRLDIAGPGLPTLAFYDLPGVINVSDVTEESYLVDLVRNLVRGYIQSKDSINLLALPMSDDPANSSALKLIRDLKAESRTIGCLTKPDRLQSGEALDQWIQLLEKTRFRLGHGYFVVKNDPNPNVSHQIARSDEKTFFEENEPWSTTLQHFSRRFGTPVLQSMLSETLTNQIRRSLPRIEAEVRHKISAIDDKLLGLPQPVQKSAPVAVMKELVAFERSLVQHLDGGNKDFLFQSQWNEIAMSFRQRLAQSKPLVVLPYMQRSTSNETPIQASPTSQPNTPVKSVSGCIDLSSDSEDLPIGSKRASTFSPKTPTKYRRLALNHSESKRFKISEITEIMQSAYTGGLPSLVEGKAVDDLIRLSMTHWKDVLSNFLQSTQQHCKQMIKAIANEIFRHYTGTAFHQELTDLLETYFEQLFEAQKKICLQLLEWESVRPKTLNIEGLARARVATFTALKEKFDLQRAHDALDAIEKKNGKITTGQARVDKAAKLTEAQLGPNKYDLELQAISNVKGYYEIAYNRFVDVICSSIYCEVFQKCRTELSHSLMEHFDVAGPDAHGRLMKLLQASPEDQELRERLLKEKSTLETAQDCIQGLR